MTLHQDLKDRLEQDYGDRLHGPVDLKQDALLLSLANDTQMEIRYATPHEYSLAWQWGDASLRIDTAPLHAGLTTWPNHLHGADGRVHADPLTVPGRDPWENVRCVLDALLADPLLPESA